jgi:antitoxin (DNA-binding transcriptional repressor) of toxin-antitoxin stability system
MYHMKKATIRDLRYRFSAVEASLAEGEEIEITRRKRVVARLLPPKTKGPRKRPDFLRRLKATYGDKVQPISGSELVSLERSRT